MSNLGNSYISLGDLIGALKAFEEVVSIYEELGDKQGLALRLGIIGNLYGEMGRMTPTPELGNRYLRAALLYYERALEIARALGDRASEAELLRGMGNAYGNMGQFDDAIKQFTAAYEIFAALGLRQQCEFVQQSINLAVSYQNRQTNL